MVERLEMEKAIKKYYPDDYSDRMDNVMELVANASQFDGTVDAYLQNVSLASSSDKESEEGAVTLQSCHSAKGLEFPVVMLCGCETGILPHAKALLEGDIESSTEEERRIFFVAITRAQKRLYLSYCRYRQVRRGRSIEMVESGPSIFLSDAGLLPYPKVPVSDSHAEEL
jgi:DNA helicase-2/ATP-dependent DNA helicase PcrA